MPGLMRAALLSLGGLLAACSAAPPPAPLAVMRDTSVPIYSMAGFAPARLHGSWQEVAHLAAPGLPACGGARLEITGQGEDLHLRGALCRAGRLTPVNARAHHIGNGRLQVSGEAEAWWVIWADYDDRSVILATPSGSFASILDHGKIPGDRLKAARDMLGYNGYRTALLR